MARSNRPEELDNSLPAKKRRGREAAALVASKIKKVRRVLTHDETVKLFCIPLSPEDAASRAMFQNKLEAFDSSLSLYFADLSKLDSKQRAFLEAYGHTGLVRDACIAAKVSRRVVAEWIENDEVFREMYEDAEEDSTDDLESFAIARAKSHSDTLMALLLKARRPNKYLDRSQIDLRKKEVPKKQAWTIGDFTLEFQ